MAYIISTHVSPLLPSASIISRVLNPVFFGKLYTHSVTKSSLGGHGSDDEQSGKVHLNPFVA